MATRTTIHTTDAGKVPVSHGREVHEAEELRFPVGRSVGQPDVFHFLEGEELYLNTLVSGGKGSGKTAGVIKPFLRFLVTHPRRCGALVLDAKGDLLPYLRGWASLVGREQDVIEISPHGERAIHLFPRGIPAESLASGIVTAAHTIAGGSNPRDQFWENSAEELIKFIITVLRMSRGDLDAAVSPSEILTMVGQQDDISLIVNRIDMRFESKQQLTPEEAHNLEYLHKSMGRYNCQDSRVRTSVEAEVFRFLKDFSGYHLTRIFAPKIDDKNAVSIADVVDEGRIIVLNMPQCEYGEVARFIGLMMKTQFYDSVMRRLRNGRQKSPRPVFLVADEYQNFATLGGKVGSDDQFAALCRQASAGMMCATQEIGSLYSVAGANSVETVSNLLQNFQNHIILQQTLTPRMVVLLNGKGMTDLQCIPKLRAFEAVLYKDTRPTPALVELGPVFASWDYAAAMAGRAVSELVRQKQSVLGHLITDGEGQRNRVVIVGDVHSRKSCMLENLHAECLMKDIPCILYAGKYDRPDSVVDRLAQVCSYDRTRIENSVIFLDDTDALSDDCTMPTSRLYDALLPVITGRRMMYGKYHDLADMGKVTIVMSATSQHRGGMHDRDEQTPCVVLPGRFAEGVRVVDIQSLDKTVETEREKS